MKATRFIGLAAIAAVTVACFALNSEDLKAGAVAPKFSGQTADGKVFSIEGALKGKPVFIYFISTSCPVSRAATPHYTAIAKAYANQGLTVVGVVNDDKAGFDRWNATHKVPYQVVLDPDKKIIKAYGITKAPSGVLVARNGSVIKSSTGYSKQVLVDTNELAAKAIKKPVTKLDFAGAPASLNAG
ncbi:MAG: TlpA family protein disulfide reductase [Armatimonadota bacterium]|nr:TlpA family protein disulfide reductase [Armatimonadota bacterium]